MGIELGLERLPVALSAAMLTLLSPCSYPFLLVIPGYYLQDTSSRVRWLAGGGAVISGFLLFASAFGLAVFLFWLPLLKYAFYFEGFAALLVILLGIATLANWHLPFYFPTVGISPGRGYRSLFTLGLAYGASAIGCTVWPFLGVVFTAVVAAKPAALALVYGSYIMTVGAGIALSIIIASQSRDLVLDRIVRYRSWVRWVTGLIFIAVGLYLFRFFVAAEIVRRFPKLGFLEIL